jgi:NitT/TauT family transport system permease protein
LGFHDALASHLERTRLLQRMFTPSAKLTRGERWAMTGITIFTIGFLWCLHLSAFMPTPGEAVRSVHDLWYNADLATNLMSSILLDLESIIIATVISLLIAYSSTLPIFRPMAQLAGKLRFSSLAGLGFAFTIITPNGHALKVAVLTFLVVVFFVVSMVDVIDAIPSAQYDLAATLKMRPWETLWRVVVRGQLDQAFVVLRQTSAMAFMFIVTAEGMSMSGGGIGATLNTISKYHSLSSIMALQLIILALGITQDQLIGWLRGVVCPWSKLGGGR